jgi:hypothetical protein
MFALLAAVFFALLQPANTAFAASATHVKHKAIDYFMPDHRIRLEATVNDPKGVKVVRAYFKAGAQADYLFVPMEAQKGMSDTFVATLPAIKKGNDTLQYLFLVVNNDNQVVKTNPFSVKEKDVTEAPSWQMVKPDGQIQLYTELDKMPSVASTYSDSVALNAVESSARFGVVASLYGSGGSAGGAAGASAATGTTNAGVVAAAGTGLSTTAIVTAAVVAGGAAAAGGGGGGGGYGGSSSSSGSGSGSGTSSGSGSGSSTNPYAGSWSGTFSGGFGGTWSGTVTSQSSNNFSGSATGYPLAGTVSQTGAMSSGTITCNDPVTGSPITGSWTGQFNLSPSRSASGNWSCGSYSGTWTGS